MKLTRPFLAVVLTALLGMGLAACGDDDETASPSPSPADEGGADNAAFCDSYVEATRLFGGDEQPDSQQANALVDSVEQEAPAEIESDVQTVVSAARDALGGNPEAFETDEAGQSFQAVQSYMVDECGYEPVEITAVDYEFQGVPESLPAGETLALSLVNEGEELHEALFFALPDGTEDPSSVLEQAGEEGPDVVASVFAFPAEEGAEFPELEPGTYGIFCGIPVGLTDEAAESDQEPPEDAEAHWQQGMIATVTVS